MLQRSYSDDMGKFILRLTLGILILLHGIAKITHPETLGFISEQLVKIGLPPFLRYGVYIGEIVAPIMLILGIFCRLAGFFVVVNMIFAIVLMNVSQLFVFKDMGGWALEIEGFFLFVALSIICLGGGRFALKQD